MTLKNIFVLIIAVISLITLSACLGNNGEQGLENSNNTETESNNNEIENESDSHADMDYSSSGEVPKELKSSENPTYEVGSKAIVETDHMEGMKGAEATIVGAYATNAYAISYTPTTGGERVNNHKWVIQEELKDTDNEILDPGTEVTLEADHMKGMEGADATIDSGEKTTVYMIDYTPTTGGEEVTNHKWVTENELSPSEDK